MPRRSASAEHVVALPHDAISIVAVRVLPARRRQTSVRGGVGDTSLIDRAAHLLAAGRDALAELASEATAAIGVDTAVHHCHAEAAAAGLDTPHLVTAITVATALGYVVGANRHAHHARCGSRRHAREGWIDELGVVTVTLRGAG